MQMGRRSFMGMALASAVPLQAAEPPLILAAVSDGLQIIAQSDGHFTGVKGTFMSLRFPPPWKPALAIADGRVHLKHAEERRVGSLSVSKTTFASSDKTPSTREVLAGNKKMASDTLRNTSPPVKGEIEELVAAPWEFLFRSTGTEVEDGNEVHQVWYAAGTWRTSFVLWLAAEGSMSSLIADGEAIIRSREWMAAN